MPLDNTTQAQEAISYQATKNELTNNTHSFTVRKKKIWKTLGWRHVVENRKIE